MSRAHFSMPRRSGFSLIIMSIVITIAALIFVSVLPGQEAGDFTIKQANNVHKLERVEEAMRSFMAFNGRRPCPADGQYPVNTANFGLEAGTPGTCSGNSAPTPNAPLTPNSGNPCVVGDNTNTTGCVVGGVIPTRSLGLPDEYQYDEFGHRFTYVVDKRVTLNSSCITEEGWNTSYTSHNGLGGVIIQNTKGGITIDNTMYAYISSGKSGYGAFPEQGGIARINSGSNDTDMQNNTSTSYTSGTFTNTFVQKDWVPPPIDTLGTTGYDELTWYRNDLKNTCCLGVKCKPPPQYGFVVDGVNTNDGTGYSVATGNIMGHSDGKTQDLIIGAENANSSAGKVYVVFGHSGTFPDPLPLCAINSGNNCPAGTPNGTTSIPGIVLAGTAGLTGHSLAAGDFIGHGNGTQDLIIGAPNTNAGAVYVVFGGLNGANNGTGTAWSTCSASSPCTLTTTGSNPFLNGTNGIEIDDAGAIATAVGNITGHPYTAQDYGTTKDLIIGAYDTGDVGRGGIGSVSLVFGGKTMMNGYPWSNCTPCTLNNTGFSTALLNTPNPNAIVFNGVGVNESGIIYGSYVGYSVAAGNVSGHSDTTQDLVIGMLGVNGDISNLGSVYVVFGGKKKGDGSSWGSATPYTLSNGSGAAYILNGINGVQFNDIVYAHSPYSIAVGNISGRSGTTQDLIIGTAVSLPSSTTDVYVVFGGTSIWTSGTPSYTLNSGSGSSYLLNGTYGIEFNGGTTTGSYMGYSVAVGNVSGHSGASSTTQDLIIGSLNGNSNTGAAYVVFGGTSIWTSGKPSYTVSSGSGSNYLLNGANGVEFDGTQVNGYTGYSVATGDINGDGIADLIIGAYGDTANSLTGAGQVYVYFGHPNTTKNPWPTPAVTPPTSPYKLGILCPNPPSPPC